MSSEFNNRRSRLSALLGVLFCLALCFSAAAAQENIDAAPIVISQADSTRALTELPIGGGIESSTVTIFKPGARTRITLYVTNLELLSGEAATAFRADAEDGRHYRYPLEVVSLAPVADRPWLYALTFKLHGGMGDVGDVLIRVNWRGMASNRVRVAIGHVGDGLADDSRAVPTPLPEAAPTQNQTDAVGLSYTGDRVRFMEQATFGPNPSTELRVRRIGYSTWINEQMEQRYDANNLPRYSTFPMPNPPLQPDNIPSTCIGTCIRDNYSMYPLQNWFFREALYGEDQQLRRRTSWALHQILVVSGRQAIQPSRMAPYVQILDKHAFGNYRDLLKEMTLNPAMGSYLDMAISTAQNPNENYAREIMQLFSIGLDMLNQDGTPILDSNGFRVPTYNQETVVGFAKVFTGWTYCNNPAVCPSVVAGTRNFKDPMLLNESNHDQTAKQVLNYPGAVSTIPSGQSGDQDLEAALDNIFYHPNVAPFISKILIQQFVTSNPTPAYVRRIADVFSDTAGGGIDRGNLRRVIRAILLDPEARGNNKTDPDYGHLKEPVLYATNFLRSLDAKSADRLTLSDGVINGVTLNLDQDVFNPPTVFSYYLFEYNLPNTNLYAPEFNIMTTGTALKRPNLINQFVFHLTFRGISANPSNNIPLGTSISLARYQPRAAADLTGAQLVDTLNRELMHGAMSSAVRTQIMNAVQAVSSADSLRRTRTAVYLVTTAPQYQVLR